MLPASTVVWIQELLQFQELIEARLRAGTEHQAWICCPENSQILFV